MLPFFDAPCGVITEGEDQIQPVTWYPNSYATLTLSADGKTLATVETKTMQNLYLLPATGSRSTKANPLLPHGPNVSWFDWSADGNLVFNDFNRLLRISIDGNVGTLFTGESDYPGRARILELAACAGHYVVFSLAFHCGTNSANIWRTNVDGTSPVKLTDGKDDRAPVCAADGK